MVAASEKSCFSGTSLPCSAKAEFCSFEETSIQVAVMLISAPQSKPPVKPKHKNTNW
jgi:hypothetical protein